RAVRLDVPHPVAGHAGEPVQLTELVQHVDGQLAGVVVDGAATEPGEVTVAHLRADADAAPDRPRTGPAHDRRVAGVEAARHVRAGDDREQGVVVADRLATVPLAEVRLDVDHSFTAAKAATSCCCPASILTFSLVASTASS